MLGIYSLIKQNKSLFGKKELQEAEMPCNLRHGKQLRFDNILVQKDADSSSFGLVQFPGRGLIIFVGGERNFFRVVSDQFLQSTLTGVELVD